jgi:hypothetical protein
MGRKWRYGPLRGGKRKGMGWACWARMRNRVWFYLFFFSPFQPFIQEIFQVFQKDLLNHTTNKSPCIQHDAQTLGYFLN